MSYTSPIKSSLKEKLSIPKAIDESKYFNHKINIARLGKQIFNKKVSENLFAMNNVNIIDRYTKCTQDTYLVDLLKASTPNFKMDSKTFQFNSNDKAGWIVLEFDIKNNQLSDQENIKYMHEFIIAEIDIEPTLIAIQDKIILVAFFFPNPPTTKDKDRLKKYRYFKDVRTALTHTLEANWSINVDNYNQTKEYKNILEHPYKLIGQFFEIAVFQVMLDDYKELDIFKKIIQIKQSAGGHKSGITKREKSDEERKNYTKIANEKKISRSKERVEETVAHILNTESDSKLTIDKVVKISKELFDVGLGHKTVAKYLPEFKYPIQKIDNI